MAMSYAIILQRSGYENTQTAIEFKKNLARELAGIDERNRKQLTSEIADYFGKVFDTEV